MTSAAAVAVTVIERRLARALHPVHPDPRALLGREADPSLLVALAERHGVLTLVADALTRAGLFPEMDEKTIERLRAAAFQSHAAHAALVEAARAALDAFDAAGIESLALKGIALGSTHYQSPAQRAMNDVDLLVRRGDVERAVEALSRSGFSVPASDVRAFWDEAYYHLPIRAPGTSRVLVELHWGVAQRDRHPVDVDTLFSRSVECEIGGCSARTLDPVDTLVHLGLHHAYHTFEPRMIWILDRALVARGLRGERLAADAWARATEWGARIPLALGLRQVEKVFPGAIPTDLEPLTRRSLRATLLAGAASSREPLALLSGWSKRALQLVYGALMVDHPGRAILALAGWAGRAARFGDRAGRRREMNEGEESAVLASAPGGNGAADADPATRGGSESR